MQTAAVFVLLILAAATRAALQPRISPISLSTACMICPSYKSSTPHFPRIAANGDYKCTLQFYAAASDPKQTTVTCVFDPTGALVDPTLTQYCGNAISAAPYRCPAADKCGNSLFDSWISGSTMTCLWVADFDYNLANGQCEDAVCDPAVSCSAGSTKRAYKAKAEDNFTAVRRIARALAVRPPRATTPARYFLRRGKW